MRFKHGHGAESVNSPTGMDAEEPEFEFVETAAPLDVRLHQCSACKYTSTVKGNVADHIRAKCPGARVLSKTCKVTYVSAAGGNSATVDGDGNGKVVSAGDNNTVNNNTTTDNRVTININFELQNGKGASESALDEMILKDREFLAALKEALTLEHFEKMPARVLEHHLGAPAPDGRPRLRAKGKNHVVEVLPNGEEDRPATRRQFARTYGGRAATALVCNGASDSVAEVLRETRAALEETKFRIGTEAVSLADIAERTATNDPAMHRLCPAGRKARKRVLDALDCAIDGVTRATVSKT